MGVLLYLLCIVNSSFLSFISFLQTYLIWFYLNCWAYYFLMFFSLDICMSCLLYFLMDLFSLKIIHSRNRNMLQNTYIVHILLYTTDLLFTANSSTSEKPSEYAHISIKFIYSKKVTKIWKKSSIFIWNSLVTSNELEDFFSYFCCLLVLVWEYRYDKKTFSRPFLYDFHLSFKNNDNVNVGTSFLLGGIRKLRWPNFAHYWPPIYRLTLGKEFVYC